MSVDITHPWLCAALAVPIWALLIGLRGPTRGTLIDVYSLNAAYVSFGASGLVFVSDLVPGGLGLELTMLAGWLLAMAAGLAMARRIRHGATLAAVETRSVGSAWYCDRVAMAAIVVGYTVYASNIFSSGLLLGDGSLDLRFLIADQGKVQAYLFSAVGLLPVVFLWRLDPHARFRTIATWLLPFWLVHLAGFSKTGAVFPVIQLSIWFLLRWERPQARRPSLRGQVVGIVAGAFAVSLLLGGLIRGLGIETTPVQLLLDRLVSSFDGLYWLTSSTFAKSGDQSLIQWYLAPFLKVLGVFGAEYNASNFVVAVQYFGFDPDYAGNLPNNNHIGELLLTTPPFLRIPAAIGSGLLYGFAYGRALSYIRGGGPWVLVAAFVCATPLGFLIDGQGWFSSMLVLACLSAGLRVIAALGWFDRRRAAARRGAGTGACANVGSREQVS